MEFLRINFKIISKQPAEVLQPYCYSTDGGALNNSHIYFIQNIFQNEEKCYCTRLSSNVHVQVYLGKKVVVNPLTIPPKDYMINSDIYKVRLPYEKYFADKYEKETFKILKALEIHNKSWGYTFYVSAYALFISHKEINFENSKVLKYFNDINSVDKFYNLNLDTKNVIYCDDQNTNVAFEINISNQKLLQSKIDAQDLDCLPVLWVASQPKYKTWKVIFKQKLVAKFMVLKLIDSSSKNKVNGIDMYNLTLYGNVLKFN